jgi:hypothetical protein
VPSFLLYVWKEQRCFLTTVWVEQARVFLAACKVMPHCVDMVPAVSNVIGLLVDTTATDMSCSNMVLGCNIVTVGTSSMVMLFAHS